MNFPCWKRVLLQTEFISPGIQQLVSSNWLIYIYIFRIIWYNPVFPLFIQPCHYMARPCLVLLWPSWLHWSNQTWISSATHKMWLGKENFHFSFFRNKAKILNTHISEIFLDCTDLIKLQLPQQIHKSHESRKTEWEYFTFRLLERRFLSFQQRESSNFSSSGENVQLIQVTIMERMVELGCDPLAANRWWTVCFCSRVLKKNYNYSQKGSFTKNISKDSDMCIWI